MQNVLVAALLVGVAGSAQADTQVHAVSAPQVRVVDGMVDGILLAEAHSGAVAQTDVAVDARRSRGRARRDAGRRERVQAENPDQDLTDNPDAVAPWTTALDLGPPVPDRWRIMEAFYDENLLDPYNNNNPLKGDKPVFGEDWFFSVLAISDTIAEPRRFPVPVGVSTTTKPNSLDTIGQGRTNLYVQTMIAEFVLLKGDTAYKPPDWEIRFTPVYAINYATSEERGVLKLVPDGGGSQGRTRFESHFAVQALFVDKHLRNVSDRYDFDSIRVGIQPFSSDFRGFLFQDNQFGVRLFGNRDNNVFQYNLAWFRRLEKDTNTGLNNLADRLRDDDVFVANLYWQDMPRLGFQSQVTLAYNRNREKGQVKFDDNQFIARPSSLFQERFARDYDVLYMGYNGDGRLGRYNLTTSFYYAFGEQTSEKFPGAEDKIRAWFFASELSRDWDWIRPRLSLLYGTGDDDPFDRTANGFDAIFENPQFAGADTSYWIRQTVPLIGGGGVVLSGRNGILNSLRSTKELGQSQFINPGIRLVGLGADFDLAPHLRLSVNANQLWFDQTKVLENLRQQSNIDRNIGQDVSVSLIFRPLVTQNVVFRLSGAALVPGDGFRDLYSEDEKLPFSVLLNVTLQY